MLSDTIYKTLCSSMCETAKGGALTKTGWAMEVEARAPRELWLCGGLQKLCSSLAAVVGAIAHDKRKERSTVPSEVHYRGRRKTGPSSIDFTDELSSLFNRL